MVRTLMRGRCLLGAVDWIAAIFTHKENERGHSFRSNLASGPVYALQEVLNLVEHL